MILTQIDRDMRLALRGGSGWFHSLFFFIVFAGFSGIAIGPERAPLMMTAPALVWLGMTLSLQVSSSDLFRPDMEDGTLALFCAEQESLVPYVIARLLAIGVTTVTPMLAIVPILYLLFGLSPSDSARATLIVIVACPVLIISCVVAAALSAGMRTGGLLGAGLAAPLIVPILIFGIGATEKLLAEGVFFSAELLFLLALTLFYAVILPPFAILSIRFGLE